MKQNTANHLDRLLTVVDHLADWRKEDSAQDFLPDLGLSLLIAQYSAAVNIRLLHRETRFKAEEFGWSISFATTFSLLDPAPGTTLSLPKELDYMATIDFVDCSEETARSQMEQLWQSGLVVIPAPERRIFFAETLEECVPLVPVPQS